MLILINDFKLKRNNHHIVLIGTQHNSSYNFELNFIGTDLSVKSDHPRLEYYKESLCEEFYKIFGHAPFNKNKVKNIINGALEVEVVD